MFNLTIFIKFEASIDMNEYFEALCYSFHTQEAGCNNVSMKDKPKQCIMK